MSGPDGAGFPSAGAWSALASAWPAADPVRLVRTGWLAWFGLLPHTFFLAPPFFIGLLSQPAGPETGRR